MRRAFLEQNKPMLFDDMVLAETLFLHLWEVQQTCEKRMELLMEELLVKNPAPDKATQQLAWVAHMNSLKVQAEEIVLQELICRNEEKLRAAMTDEQKALFEKYTDCIREHQTITECLVFQNSFKPGARMMLEVMEE